MGSRPTGGPGRDPIPREDDNGPIGGAPARRPGRTREFRGPRRRKPSTTAKSGTSRRSGATERSGRRPVRSVPGGRRPSGGYRLRRFVVRRWRPSRARNSSRRSDHGASIELTSGHHDHVEPVRGGHRPEHLARAALGPVPDGGSTNLLRRGDPEPAEGEGIGDDKQRHEPAMGPCALVVDALEIGPATEAPGLGERLGHGAGGVGRRPSIARG